MKDKTLLWILALIFIISSASIVYGVCSTDESDYIFYEDWENGFNATKWDNITCNFGFTTDAYLGTSALNVTHQDATNCLKTDQNTWFNNVTTQFAIKVTTGIKTLETLGPYKADNDWYYLMTIWGAPDISANGFWAWFDGGSWQEFGVAQPNTTYQVVKIVTNASLGKFSVYHDGVFTATDVSPRAMNFASQLPNKTAIGKQTHTAGSMLIDNIMIWNRTIYGDTCPQGAASHTDIDLSISDAWNSTSINDFNISLTWNNGTSETYTTTNGTISLYNVSESDRTINVTFYGMTDYFNKTLLNQAISANTSNTISTTTFQAYACFNATEKISTNAVTPDNITIINITRTSCFNITAGTYNVMAQKAGWNSKNQSFTIPALSNATYTIANLSYNLLTIFAKDITDGSYLTGYQLNLTSLNYTGWAGEHYASTQNQTFNLINGTYNILIDASGYALQGYEANVSVTGATNYTFLLYPSNSLNISFYDEDTGNLVPAGINITYEIILNDENATTGNINTSVAWHEGLDAGDYEIRYRATAEGYGERSYYFTLSNRTYNELSLYLLNSSDTESITTTLYDEYGNTLEGYTIRLLRYYASLSAYVVVDEGLTNSEGQTIVSAIRNGPYYKFRIVSPASEVLKTTSSTQIYDTSISLYVTLGEGIGETLTNLNGISYELVYLNASKQFRFTWDASDGLLVSVATYVYETDALNGDTLHNSSTSTSASGTMYIGIAAENDTTYKAMSYVTFTGDDEPTLLDTLSVSFDEPLATFGKLGLFLTFIIVVTFALTGVFNPAAPCILVPLAMIITRIARLHALEWTWIVAITAVGAIILYIIRDKT